MPPQQFDPPAVVQLISIHNIFRLVIAIIVLRLALWLANRLFARPNPHHRQMLRDSARALKRLRRYDDPADIIHFIRDMHPHAVEELMLTAAQRAGHKIRRNKRYTGDGGIDGMIRVRGKWHLVQTKRYSGTINAQHVQDFADVCSRKRMPGLFIHVGRTGRLSKIISRESRRVHIISGEAVIDLIKGMEIRV